MKPYVSLLPHNRVLSASNFCTQPLSENEVRLMSKIQSTYLAYIMCLDSFMVSEVILVSL